MLGVYTASAEVYPGAVLQAEAERFVLRPFLRGNENSMERHTSRPATAGEAPAGTSMLLSKASMLQRLRTKSILECVPLWTCLTCL